jgi:hypothetical protein
MRSLVFSRNDAGKLTSDDHQKVKGLVSTLNDDKRYSNGKVMVAL